MPALKPESVTLVRVVTRANAQIRPSSLVSTTYEVAPGAPLRFQPRVASPETLGVATRSTGAGMLVGRTGFAGHSKPMPWSWDALAPLARAA